MNFSPVPRHQQSSTYHRNPQIQSRRLHPSASVAESSAHINHAPEDFSLLHPQDRQRQPLLVHLFILPPPFFRFHPYQKQEDSVLIHFSFSRRSKRVQRANPEAAAKPRERKIIAAHTSSSASLSIRPTTAAAKKQFHSPSSALKLSQAGSSPF